MTTEQEARHKRFDEKFDRINKTVVTIETFEGFGLEEQRPASDEIKSFLDSEVALAVAQREQMIRDSIKHIFFTADQREDRVELSDIENVITPNK